MQSHIDFLFHLDFPEPVPAAEGTAYTIVLHRNKNETDVCKYKRFQTITDRKMSSPPFIRPVFAQGNLIIYRYLLEILCFSLKQMFVSVIFFVVCLKNGPVKMFARKERGYST